MAAGQNTGKAVTKLTTNVMLGELEIVANHVDLFPSAGTHDRRGMEPRSEQVLSRAYAQ